MNGKKYIYDIKMANFFMMNGAVATGTGTNNKTGKVFWCFEYDSCQDAYEKWNILCNVKTSPN